jgi:hypothetical protein
MAFNQTLNLVGPYASSSAGASGSSSYSFSAPAAGPYFLEWKAQVPTVVDGGGASGLVVKISNATGPVTIFLGTAGACSSGRVDFVAAAADVITFNLSSTAAADLASLNAIQCTIAIGSGV